MSWKVYPIENPSEVDEPFPDEATATRVAQALADASSRDYVAVSAEGLVIIIEHAESDE